MGFYGFGRKFHEHAVGNYVRSRHSFETEQFKFDMRTCQATSYGDWIFVLKIGKTIYFNDYYYSDCTAQHQKMAKNILDWELTESFGYKIKKVYIRHGLNDIQKEIRDKRYLIDELVTKISNPKSRKATNEERRKAIDGIYKEIAELEKLDKIFSKQILENEKMVESFEDADREKKIKKELYKNELHRNSSVESCITVSVKRTFRKSGYVALEIYGKKAKEFHVMQFMEYQSMNLREKFDLGNVIALHPIDGKTLEEARTKLNEKIKVQDVLARLKGQAVARKEVI